MNQESPELFQCEAMRDCAWQGGGCGQGNQVVRNEDALCDNCSSKVNRSTILEEDKEGVHFGKKDTQAFSDKDEIRCT